MSIIDTTALEQTKDAISDAVQSGLDAVPFDIGDLELPSVDLSDTVTTVASTVVSTGRGTARTLRRVTRTVRRNPRTAGIGLAVVLALVGIVVWRSRRATGDDERSLRVAAAA